MNKNKNIQRNTPFKFILNLNLNLTLIEKTYMEYLAINRLVTAFLAVQEAEIRRIMV
jgi:hypothetical protein